MDQPSVVERFRGEAQKTLPTIHLQAQEESPTGQGQSCDSRMQGHGFASSPAEELTDGEEAQRGNQGQPEVVFGEHGAAQQKAKPG